MPMYFTLSFQVLNVPFAPAGAQRNIMDIIDLTLGTSLLSVATTDTGKLRLMYGGTTVFVQGPALDASGSGLWSVITVTFQPFAVLISSSADIGFYIVAPPPTPIDTTGHIYQLYFSNNYEFSAGGQFRSFSIRGKVNHI